MGFCTPRRTVMESKKKKTGPRADMDVIHQMRGSDMFNLDN